MNPLLNQPLPIAAAALVALVALFALLVLAGLAALYRAILKSPSPRPRPLKIAALLLTLGALFFLCAGASAAGLITQAVFAQRPPEATAPIIHTAP